MNKKETVRVLYLYPNELPQTIQDTRKKYETIRKKKKKKTYPIKFARQKFKSLHNKTYKIRQ